MDTPLECAILVVLAARTLYLGLLPVLVLIGNVKMGLIHADGQHDDSHIHKHVGCLPISPYANDVGDEDAVEGDHGNGPDAFAQLQRRNQEQLVEY